VKLFGAATAGPQSNSANDIDLLTIEIMPTLRVIHLPKRLPALSFRWNQRRDCAIECRFSMGCTPEMGRKISPEKALGETLNKSVHCERISL